MSLTLDEQLLFAALCCGLQPNGSGIHRMQLFFVANKELRAKTHQMAYQKALENGVERRGFWKNYGGKGGGEYALTHNGYNEAKGVFGDVRPKYQPVLKKGCNFELRGGRGGERIVIQYRAARMFVYINGRQISPAIDVCRMLAIEPTKGVETAQIYDYAVEHNFEFVWIG